jgi:dTDP-4-dehydrorhamnose 3,5-epimerase
MKIVETTIPGVLTIEPQIFRDNRGFFTEFYQADRYAKAGIGSAFVQDNLSRSARGILRGLHIQNPKPQGKLISVLSGAVLDVVVDVRVGSPTFGHHYKVELNDSSRRQLWVPPGLAHGFMVLSDTADFFYKCDEFYSPADELVLKWNDPDIAIDWGGITTPELSQRDRNGRPLQDLLPRLPKYSALLR